MLPDQTFNSTKILIMCATSILMKHEGSSAVWLCKNRKYVSTHPLRLDPSQNVRVNAPSNALEKSHTTSLGDFAADLFH